MRRHERASGLLVVLGWGVCHSQPCEPGLSARGTREGEATGRFTFVRAESDDYGWEGDLPIHAFVAPDTGIIVLDHEVYSKYRWSTLGDYRML